MLEHGVMVGGCACGGGSYRKQCPELSDSFLRRGCYEDTTALTERFFHPSYGDRRTG